MLNKIRYLEQKINYGTIIMLILVRVWCTDVMVRGLKGVATLIILVRGLLLYHIIVWIVWGTVIWVGRWLRIQIVMGNMHRFFVLILSCKIWIGSMLSTCVILITIVKIRVRAVLMIVVLTTDIEVPVGALLRIVNRTTRADETVMHSINVVEMMRTAIDKTFRTSRHGVLVLQPCSSNLDVKQINKKKKKKQF